jgi:uncharacterized protein with GYD domain
MVVQRAIRALNFTDKRIKYLKKKKKRKKKTHTHTHTRGWG